MPDDKTMTIMRPRRSQTGCWQLEAEYDYLHSDDFLAESMAEETFDEDGSII